MALMWPRKLPAYITSDILRTAECRVFKQLQHVLEDSFVVFYSRPWLGLTHLGEEKDGECDFLIAHPDLGILAIEVKGGAVAYNPRDESWTSRDRWGIIHKIKNPVNQARTSKHQIINKLQESRAWKPRRIRARHGIIFPDSERPESDDLGADMPISIFCFLDDFETNLRGWIGERFGETDGLSPREHPLGHDGIAALEDLLAKPFQLHVPIGKILEIDDSEIETLTHQQYHILTAIQDIPRAAISGGAGTGKTVLAMEEAIRHAKAGLNVLLTCYNRPLAADIHFRLEPWKSVTVVTFHELCIKFAREADIVIPDGLPYDRVFNEQYPAILVQALSVLPNRLFDVIIVDEGQDFLPNWLAALDKALKPGGLIRIFYDSNQSVYHNIKTLTPDFQISNIRLTLNLRNTRRIHEVIQNYYTGLTTTAIGPEGVEVDWIPAESDTSICKAIDKKIRQLISAERVHLSDIAVLMASNQEIVKCAPDDWLGDERCQRADSTQQEGIILDTVRRFKGLERRVVILAATPSLIGDRELIYVGVSRARTHLIIIGDISGIRSSAVLK